MSPPDEIPGRSDKAILNRKQPLLDHLPEKPDDRNPHGGDLVAKGLRAALQNANGDPRADDGVERVLIGFERKAGGVPVEFGEPRLDALNMSLQRGDDARPDREQLSPSQRRGE